VTRACTESVLDQAAPGSLEATGWRVAHLLSFVASSHLAPPVGRARRA